MPESPPAAPYPGQLVHTEAPVPTRRTIRRRTSLPLQAYRFGAISWKMLQTIRRTHQH